jgi:hypothetical protein
MRATAELMAWRYKVGESWTEAHVNLGLEPGAWAEPL